jgi:hypothetical protein
VNVLLIPVMADKSDQWHFPIFSEAGLQCSRGVVHAHRFGPSCGRHESQTRIS